MQIFIRLENAISLEKLHKELINSFPIKTEDLRHFLLLYSNAFFSERKNRILFKTWIVTVIIQMRWDPIFQ